MLTDVIGSLRKDPEFSERVTHWEVVPARAGSYAELPPEVDGRIRQALQARGIGRIYSHQLATWFCVYSCGRCYRYTPCFDYRQ